MLNSPLKFQEQPVCVSEIREDGSFVEKFVGFPIDFFISKLCKYNMFFVKF